MVPTPKNIIFLIGLLPLNDTFYNAKFQLVPTRVLPTRTLVPPAKHGLIPNLLVIQRQHGLMLLQLLQGGTSLSTT